MKMIKFCIAWLLIRNLWAVKVRDENGNLFRPKIVEWCGKNLSLSVDDDEVVQ